MHLVQDSLDMSSLMGTAVVSGLLRFSLSSAPSLIFMDIMGLKKKKDKKANFQTLES